MKKSTVIRLVEIALCIVGIIMLNTAMAPCISDKAMKCNATTHAVEMLLVNLILLALLGCSRKISKVVRHG